MPRAVPRTQGVTNYGGDYYLALHLPSGPSHLVIPRNANAAVAAAAAAAAKSLQSCPTLCDPHIRQPTRR